MADAAAPGEVMALIHTCSGPVRTVNGGRRADGVPAVEADLVQVRGPDQAGVADEASTGPSSLHLRGGDHRCRVQRHLDVPGVDGLLGEPVSGG